MYSYLNIWTSLNFQDANSPTMEHMIFFHDHSMTLMIFIMTLIFFILFKFLYKFPSFSKFSKSESLEMIWTLLPILILIFMALPSMKTLYLFEEESSSPLMSIKILGNQWFWNYDFPEFDEVSFDSYMEKMNYMNCMFPYLDSDTRLTIPYNIQVRFLTSSKDVIHSWSIPNLGMKIDAIPGRINQSNSFLMRPGIFFGNCMEICGENHSSMPITLEVTNLKNFIYWLYKF